MFFAIYCQSYRLATILMAHNVNIGFLRKRRSTTTAIFLLPFCEKAFFMKESPPQMSPPAFLFAF